MTKSVPLVHYLFTRLRQLGIEAVHGVPGDFNLISLDYLEGAGLEWVGDANELNAGYAADGYARIKGIGALMTTFGVGELSAINAVAGSYAERVPIVHIAGSPSTNTQEAKLILHHTLGDGNFKVFKNIYSNVTVAQATLDDIRTAPQLIDSTLRTCWIQRRPVYFELPTNMVTVEVDPTPLDTPIDLSLSENDQDDEKEVVKAILERIYSANSPMLLVDACVMTHRITAVVDKLVRLSKLPTFVTPMGKSAVDESLTNFVGVYGGAGSNEEVRRYIESSDLVIHIGALKSDLNTSGFTDKLPISNTIELHSVFCRVGYAHYNVHMQGVLPALVTSLDVKRLDIRPPTPTLKTDIVSEKGASEYPAGTITHNYLWPKLSTWLQPNDIILTETGTSNLGVWSTKFPTGVVAISQGLWGSIGYTLPAAQGAALASRELGRNQRVILFEGDGSFQLTAQAIGTMAKLDLDIVIFLINNEGYTIERFVHGMNAGYNDIAKWKYAKIPEAMGANGEVFVVKTTGELEALWEREDFKKVKGLKFVEMIMPKEDAPTSLKVLCGSAAKTNSK